MNHYLYQIVCLVPNKSGVLKIYSGVRSCECPIEDDDYFGTGKYIKSAVKFHGKDKFLKIIVGTYKSRKDAYEAETVWLEKKFELAGRNWEAFRSIFYNLRLNSNRGDRPIFSDQTLEKMRASRVGKRKGADNHMYGRKGENHPRFGRGDEISGSHHCQFKGYSVGFNENNVVILVGGKDMKSRGFSSSTISYCLQGKRFITQHKGFKWVRTKIKSEIEALLSNRTFYDDKSKEIFDSIQ